jgi:transposase
MLATTTDAGADRIPPGVTYVNAPDRKAERPMAHPADFAGVLHVDGYGGYRVLAEKTGVRLAFC